MSDIPISPDDVKQVALSGEGRAKENAALRMLTGLINTPEFSTSLDGNDGQFSKPPADDGSGPATAPADPIPTATEQKTASPRKGPRVPLPPLKKSNRPAIAPAPAPAAPGPDRVEVASKTLPARVFTTGRLKAGKDHFLGHFGYSIIGFADPLYAIQKFFFHTDDKKLPGARKFLQTIGQWGRGEINAEYPLTPARAMFTHLIKNLGKREDFLREFQIEWQAFGSPNLWLDSLVRRASTLTALRVGVSNVRFQNEYDGLTSAGWTHYHVMCSKETLEARLKASGLTLKSPEVNDMSEQLALGMDADVLRRIQLQPTGPKLRVIWNDESRRSPSPRLYTLPELV